MCSRGRCQFQLYVLFLRAGLTEDLHEMENRYGRTVRSTSGELSSNRKSAGIARAILRSELK